MIEDIANAKDSVYLETYRFGNDPVGILFRDVLTKKSREGVKIKLLLDSWGSILSEAFFSGLIAHGGQVRFFKKLRFFFDPFTRNHKRNHRKLLVIDNRISYIGSANIAGHSLHWRELVMRIEGPVSGILSKSYLSTFEQYKAYTFKKYAQKKTLRYGDFEIIQDIPSVTRQKVKRRFEQLINNATSEVLIETPYFVPGFKLRKALADAGKRGVNVQVIIPFHSDVRLVDILRGKYLGQLHLSNVKIQYYQLSNLHAKCMLIDKKIYTIGSSNFDYRSFRYQFEIMLLGRDAEPIEMMDKHLQETLLDCIPFDYEKWLKRPMLQKFFEWLLLPLRHLL
jgi:cardiolipin synthase